MYYYFSLSRNFINNAISEPYNTMIYSNSSLTKNLFDISISLEYPTIYQFIQPEKILKHSESKYESFRDYYIYKTITSELTENSIYQMNFDNYAKNSSVLKDMKTVKDRIALPYLPFFGNCEIIGSHITFNDIFSHPTCKLFNETVLLFNCRI
jgi:hypothetical protein